MVLQLVKKNIDYLSSHSSHYVNLFSITIGTQFSRQNKCIYSFVPTYYIHTRCMVYFFCRFIKLTALFGKMSKNIKQKKIHS